MKQRWLILALTTLLVAPGAAVAKWGGKGWEPDTQMDADDGWMFEERDTIPTAADGRSTNRQVYFSAFEGQNFGLLLSSSLTLSLGTVETSHASSPRQSFALMGVWKDCNNDGYIGFADHGLWEYPTPLLTSTFGASICKAGSIPNPIPCGWEPPHNDGSWVIEFIPITWDLTDCDHHNAALGSAKLKDANPWNINVEGARVWGDFGLPGAEGRLICWISGVPVGTYHTMGGIVDYVDCFSAHRVNGAIATATSATGTGGQWNSFRATENPWGDPEDGSYVTVFDCPKPQLAHQQLTTTIGVGVSPPRSSPSTSTAGSPSGTVNETASALDDCDRSDNGGGEWEHAAANAAYAHESSNLANQYDEKYQTDAWMNSAEGSRPPLGPAAAATNQLGRSTSKDPARLQDPEGFWNGRSVQTTYQSFYTAGRDTVDEVKHWTFYAYIPPTAISQHRLVMPKGSAMGDYGFEACGATIGAGAPAAGGWICDPALWWGGDATLLEKEQNNGITQTYQISVGQKYNLRDVDCFDESVMGARDAGVHWGIATGTQCA